MAIARGSKVALRVGIKILEPGRYAKLPLKRL